MDVKLSWDFQQNLGHSSLKLAYNHSNAYLHKYLSFYFMIFGFYGNT